MEYIALDVHKHYTWALVEDEHGRVSREGRSLTHLRPVEQILVFYT
jgi:hypothetical protein